MIKKSEVENFLGAEVGVLDAEGKECTKIVIVEIKNTDSEEGAIIIGDDGWAYNEDQINWHYRLTLGSICYCWLADCGYVDKDDILNSDAKEYEEMLVSLLDTLVAVGILGKGNEENNASDNISANDVMARWLFINGFIDVKESMDLSKDYKEHYKKLFDLMYRQGYLDTENT